MHNNNLSNWNPGVLRSSPLFKPLSVMQPFLDQHQQAWPSLENYQQLLQRNVPELRSEFGAPLKFVSQDNKSSVKEGRYEQRVYLKGEIQTRLNNWHDFFQVLVWNTFPRIKSTLNGLHYAESQATRQKNRNNVNRGPLENSIALFDECGSIILSCNDELLNCIQNFQWQDLFFMRRQQIDRHLRCFVFGHAMYEKALNPYIGMTSPAILLSVNAQFFSLSLAKQLHIADNRIAKLFKHRTVIQSPQDLHPFPLLGMPGWYNGKQDEKFYANTRYFRPGRRKPNL